jgi:hypothetical protein
MAHGNVTDEELAELIRRTAEAASAFMRGEIRRYLMLITHADDYTLMAPFGGEPTRGFDASSERLKSMERYFQAGKGGSGTCAVIRVRRDSSSGGDRTAAWRGRRSAGPGLVAARDLGLSP